MTLERMIAEERAREDRLRELAEELQSLTEQANRIAARYRRAQGELDDLKGKL